MQQKLESWEPHITQKSRLITCPVHHFSCHPPSVLFAKHA